jgi:AraC-like DNA-binding protein
MPLLVRTACLTHYREVALATGLSPQQLMADAGLNPTVLRELDLKVPAERVRWLLEASAARSRDESFGLRMAEARQISNLGPVGILMREQPTLRDVLDVLLRHHRFLNAALALAIEESAGVAVLRVDVLVADGRLARQAVELAVGVLMRVLRQFLGADWEPRCVEFAHTAPRDPAFHHRMLGRRLAFGRDFNGIVCHAADLDVANPSADRVMARYAQQLLETSVGLQAATMSDDVRHAITMLLPGGRCSIRQVADHLGMACRTVQRRLAEQGEAFSGLVDEARMALAARHLGDGSRPLGEVAALLGFSEQSGFSRWHREKFGCTPKSRRAASSVSGLRPDAGIGALVP